MTTFQQLKEKIGHAWEHFVKEWDHLPHKSKTEKIHLAIHATLISESIDRGEFFENWHSPF